MKISKQQRILQFVEALDAAAAAYDGLADVTKQMIERSVQPGLGDGLRAVATVFEQGVRAALEAEKNGAWSGSKWLQPRAGTSRSEP